MEVKRRDMLGWFTGSLAGSALPARAQLRDNTFILHAPPEVAGRPMGTLAGSIGFDPPGPEVSALSFHLKPLDARDFRVEIFATNRPNHPHWRAPDVDSGAERFWVFTGRLPVGRYEIALAGIGEADARNIHWISLQPPIQVEVLARGAVYAGRWQFSLSPQSVPGPRLVVPGTPLVLRDAFAEDRAVLERTGRDGAFKDGPVKNVLRELFGPGT